MELGHLPASGEPEQTVTVPDSSGSRQHSAASLRGAAEWLRLGVMHRNSFVDAPRYLTSDLRLRGFEHVWLAGQITGAEGYVEAAACGAIAALSAAQRLRGLEPLEVPADTALGAIVAHLQNATTADFQPSNVSWAFFSPLERRVRDKRERRGLLAERALAKLAAWQAELDARVQGSVGVPA